MFRLRGLVSIQMALWAVSDRQCDSPRGMQVGILRYTSNRKALLQIPSGKRQTKSEYRAYNRSPGRKEKKMFVKSERTPRSIPFFRAFALSALAVAMLSFALLSGCASGQASQSAATASGSAQAASSASSVSAQQNQVIEATVVVKNADDPAAAPQTYTVEVASDNATAFDAIEAADMDIVIEDGQYGKYITSIGGKAAAGTSGWVYTVNGEQVMESIDSYQLADGDTIELEYISM